MSIRNRFHRLIANTLDKLSDRLKVRAIHHQGGLYLKRFYVGTLFGYYRIYLHNFIQSDPDGLHSHPWRYGISIILCGNYIEERRFGYRRIRCFNVVNCDTFHRVIIPDINKIDKINTWSLFIHTPRVCNWGFLRPKGIITQYVEVGDKEPAKLSEWYKAAPTGREWKSL